MPKEPLTGGYDDIQDSAPTNPRIGDTWLDTSTDPPASKVYADLGSGGQWTTDLIDVPTSSRSSHDWDPNGTVATNLDAQVSNAGASQNDVADGVDESAGRWRTIFDGGLVGSADSLLTISSSGANVYFTPQNMRIRSTTDGDHGHLTVGGHTFNSYSAGETLLGAGTLLLSVSYASHAGIPSDDHGIGVAPNSSGFDSANNIALIRPHIGDQTSGNVRVDSGGADTNGSVQFGELSDLTRLVVILDWAGNYVTAGSTAFYVGGDPREGDSADAVINAIPAAADRPLGVHYEAEGNDHGLAATQMEVAVRP